MERRLTTGWLIAVGSLIECLFLLYRFAPGAGFRSVDRYRVVFIAVFGLVAVAAVRASRQSAGVDRRVVLAFCLLFSITLVGSEPEMSDDVYRYLWDGKVLSGGVNPYRYAPDDPELAPYRSRLLPARVNFPHIKTIYPPLAQIIFTLSHWIFGESVTGFKWILILFFFIAILFFDAIRRMRGISSGVLLLFAWHPLIIMETAINGHLDIVMLAAVLAFVWAFLNQRFLLSAAALSAAVLIKLIPLVLVPVSLWHLWRSAGRKMAVLWSALLASTIALALAPFMPHALNMFNTALNYSSYWYFNNPGFLGILALVQHNPLAHLLAFLLLLAGYGAILASRMPWRRRVVAAWLLLILCNPTIHPWYLITLAGLMCLRCSVPVLVWSGSVVFSYATVRHFLITGIWNDMWVWMALEYLPVGLLLLVPGLNRFLRARLCGAGGPEYQPED